MNYPILPDSDGFKIRGFLRGKPLHGDIHAVHRSATLKTRLSSLSALTIAVLVLAFGCAGRDNGTPLIFAAASLADALEEAAEVYEAETGNRVEFSFGGSTALANQISRLNAPADGVILAGIDPVRVLEEGAVITPDDVAVIARNSLVVVSQDNGQIRSLEDLVGTDSRIAIADPALAPAGQYAKEALVSAGVWDDLEGRVVPTLNVRAALAAAGSGSAGFAIVYATDVLADPGLNVVLSVDEQLHAPVVYPAVAIVDADAAAAANTFFGFLLGARGRSILERHGFTAPN